MSELIEVKNLKKYFETPKGMLHAVDDVTMSIRAGETMGVVGESGCGKSTLGRTILRLLPSTDGHIYFDGEDITGVTSKKELRELHKKAQLIFQDPYSSLNPRMTVEDTLKEPLILSKKYTKQQIKEETQRIMDLVGIDNRIRLAYPHELDGGRRQRVGIGRALAYNPKFIVCDEPVSALDVSIQAQILNLLMELQENYGLTYMFITHNMSVVRHISHNISVMYLGQLVETSSTRELFRQPMHPYTKALLSAVPFADPDASRARNRIKLTGDVPSPMSAQTGCKFASRCSQCTKACREEAPTLREVRPGHFVSCHLYDEERS